MRRARSPFPGTALRLCASVAAAASAASAAFVLSACGDLESRPGRLDSAVYDGRSPALAAGGRQRVVIQLERPPLAKVLHRHRTAESQRRYVDSLEGDQYSLRRSFESKGIRFRDVRPFTRVFDGFAATVRAGDVPKLERQGVRVRTVRRFFPATADAARGAGRKGRPSGDAAGVSVTAKGLADHAAAERPAAPRRRRLALLDTGVDYRSGALGGRMGSRFPIVAGFDAVDGDIDPSPGGTGRDPWLERHGTDTARLLAGFDPARPGTGLLPRGAGIYAIRVASPHPDHRSGGRITFATTDTLVAGLERAVDPDGDGSVDDAIPVALVGVNAPYAGFEDSPEALAATGAASAGTLVVAPVGNEGAGGSRFGSVGSPGASPSVLAVGAVDEPTSVPRVEMSVLSPSSGVLRVTGILLSTPEPGSHPFPGGLPLVIPRGPSQGRPDVPAGVANQGASVGHLTGLDGRSKVSGAAVALRPEGSVAAQVAAAKATGARMLVLVEPDSSGTSIPVGTNHGDFPVVGVEGPEAEALLDALSEGDGAVAISGGVVTTQEGGDDAVARYSSRGPTYSFEVKPDLVAAAEGLLAPEEEADPSDVVRGTSVAAARVAAAAVGLRARRPHLGAEGTAAALTAGARPVPGSTPVESGAGIPRLADPVAPVALPEPRTLSLGLLASGEPWRVVRRLRLSSPDGRPRSVSIGAEVVGRARTSTAISASPATVEIPGRGSATVELAFHGIGTDAPGLLQGFVVIESAGGDPASRVPFVGYIGARNGAILGDHNLQRRDGDVVGTRLAVGSVERAELGRRVTIEPVKRLRLELRRAGGGLVAELTPAGGTDDLMPGEYAYSLDDGVVRRLPRGRYIFRAAARSVDGGPWQVRDSEAFESGRGRR